MSEYIGNPLGREYTKAEIAAGVRVGVARKEKKYNPWPQVEIVTTGQMIYATGSYWPNHARKMANDWALVADAMEREWSQDDEEPAPAKPGRARSQRESHV